MLNVANMAAAGIFDIGYLPKFATQGIHPYDEINWTKRTAQIKDDNGTIIFEQPDFEVPGFWSELATNIVVSKYAYGKIGTAAREVSAKQIIDRVVAEIVSAGTKYFDTAGSLYNYSMDLTWLLVNQYGSFNSPVWFNLGVHSEQCEGWVYEEGVVRPVRTGEHRPQISACFIQSVQDTMTSICDLATSEMMLFKRGSGTGTDLSTLRSSRERLSGGGKPTGPLGFMRVYDAGASVVRSGGVTRRAAKIQTLKVWHPDIIEFIECKAKEEKKAHALIAAGYEANFNGEAYGTVLYQNANLSVRVTDEFLQAVEQNRNWDTIAVTTGKVMETFPAKLLIDKMAGSTWLCGDPGIQYEDTIQKWHTCPNTAPINSTNPCSEYVFIDDSACNLASTNLMKFRCNDGSFDIERFKNACTVFITAQEILVDLACYPTAKIAENSHNFRPLGLGYANLGALLMSYGLAYDSKEARGIAGAITAIMHGQANLTSAEYASRIGPFDGYRLNQEPMLHVMQMHNDAVDQIDDSCPGYLIDAARQVWNDCLEQGKTYGYRNSQVTVLAPTGTVALMMDCDTTGIEPDIALVKYKSLAGRGNLKIVNQTVPLALTTLGYDKSTSDTIISYISVHDAIEGCPDLKPEHLPVFDCAFSALPGGRTISWRGHVKMMAAAQPFISGAISKTVNMPQESTVEDIRGVYIEGWKLGLKAIAIYRDGSKGSQPVSTKSEKPVVERYSVRHKMPRERTGRTIKIAIGGHEGYMTINDFDDGTPGEVFFIMQGEGSINQGFLNALGKVSSLALQHGVPLASICDKLEGDEYAPLGPTGDPAVPICRSITDYVGRKLRSMFLSGPQSNGHSVKLSATASTKISTNELNVYQVSEVYDRNCRRCSNCSHVLSPGGGCMACPNCGTSNGACG